MRHRDRAVVAALVVLLAVIGAALAVPRDAPADPVADLGDSSSLPPPATYREGVVGIPESITPLTARSRAERTLVGLIFSGLVRPGPDNRLEPDLASSWTSDDDGKTWTFRIRSAATWQDGVPVTADDVVFTVRALKNPQIAGARSAAWAEVEASAVDEHTVRFTLATPIGGFLAATIQPLLPAHLLGDLPLEELATSEFAHLPVGTGPFALTELDDSHAVLLPAGLVAPQEESTAPPTDSLATDAAPPTPARPLPYLDRIEISFYADNLALQAAFRAGDVDAAAGLPPAMAEPLADVPGATAIHYPTTTLSCVLLNLRPSHPELRDARVRRALLGAIDRDALVADALDRAATRAHTLVPPNSWAYDAEAAAPVAFDAEASAKLLRDAGWTRADGKWTAPGASKAYRLEIVTVPGDANPRLSAVAGFVRDAWTRLGFDVTLVRRSASELASRLREGRFTAAVVEIAMGAEPDLYPLLASSQVRSEGSNLIDYQDPAMDVLLEKARAPGTQDERVAAWKALITALAERQPILPLAWEDEVVVVRGVQGITPRLIVDPGDRFGDVLAWRLAAAR